jgi:hypothetical protein
MEPNNPYAEYSSPQLYQDASGRGAVINPPIADPRFAMQNMSTLRPMGGQPQGQMPPQEEEDQLQEEDFDYLSSLFDGENLSENFKFKAKTIFEAAIAEKVSIIEAHIIQAAKEILEHQQEAAREVVLESRHETEANLVEHMDGYLNYVIAEWMQENKVAVERGLRTEIAENFINGLKDLFENSFIDVPQEKYNVLDDIYEANAELQNNVNTLIKENIDLKNEINAHLCAEAFMQQTSGLTDTQIEKLAKLSEGIEFESPEQYAQKVALLKESYFNGNTSTNVASNFSTAQVPLTEDADYSVSSNAASGPLMESVMNTISFMSKNQSKPQKVFNSESSSRLASLINKNISQDNFI